MRIQIKSRQAIERLAASPFQEKTALISITDYGCEPAELGHQPDFLLTLEFDDVDADVFADELGKNRTPKECLAVEEKYHMFSDEQAQQIAEFYRKIRNNADVLICQCEHGQSRSAAIAAAILEHSAHAGIKIFADERYYPNKFIFNKMLKAIAR